MIRSNWQTGQTGHVEEHNALSSRALSETVNVVDYGAIPDSDSSNSYIANNAAFAAAITAAKHTNNLYKEIFVPPGDYYISDTILILGAFGLKLRAAGMSSRLMWRGDTGKPALQFRNSRQCRVDYLGIEAVNPLSIGLQTYRLNPASLSPTQNTFHSMTITNAITSVRIGDDAGTDANNDFMHFTDCEFSGYTQYGVDQSNSSESYNNIFDNCRCAGAPGLSSLFTGVVGAGFWWRGGGVGSNTVADFQIGRSNQPALIELCDSENSNRFLQNINSLYGAVSVRSCRVAMNSLNADGKVILIDRAYWPLLCNVEVANTYFIYEPVGVEAKVHVDWSDTGNGGFIFTNNVIFSSTSSVFSGRLPQSKYGSIRVLDDSLNSEPL